MKIRLVTVTWGESFADIFLRIGVRSLLAPGNIGALATRHQVAYTIHTTAPDARKLRSSALFQRLASLLPVEIVIFDPAEIDAKDLAIHWIYWRRTAELAKRNQEILFFIIPDMLFATGTLLRWASLFEQGYRAVWTAVPQVVLETTIEEVEAHFPAALSDAIALDLPAIHRLLIRQLHPYMICMYRDSGRRVMHPEIVIAEVPGSGMVMRAIVSHLFCIDPRYFSTTDALSPTNKLELIAFDQLQGVCLERMLKHVSLHYRPMRLDEERLSNLGGWLHWFCSPADMMESYHNYRLLGRTVVDEKAFRPVEIALGFLAAQVRLTGAIFRVLHSLRVSGCRLAAQLGAAAHYAARLRRRWPIKGSVTLLVPDDGSLEALDAGELAMLLSAGNEKLLIDAVLAHVFPGSLMLAIGDGLELAAGQDERVSAVDGTQYRLSPLAPVKITAGPWEVDDCTIYVVDRPLFRRALKRAPAGTSMLPNRWSPNPTRIAELPLLSVGAGTAKGRSSGTNAGATIAPLRPAVRRVLRRAYRIASSLPGLRQRAAIMLAAYEAYLRNGRAEGSFPYWLGRRLLRRAYRLPGKLACALPGVRRLAPIALSFREARARRRWMIAERQAALARVAAAQTATPALAAAATVAHRASSSRPTASAEQIVERFRLLQTARIVLNLAEVLTFHRDKMAGLGMAFAPLAAIEDCVHSCGLSEDRLLNELQRIVQAAPDFAEAWLELGHTHLDRGEYDHAATCFDRSIAGRAFLPVGEGLMTCLAAATFARALVFERQGRTTAASEAYEKAFSIDSRPALMHLGYARVLRRLGRYREAMFHWDVGMQTDAQMTTPPPLPSDFRTLARQLEEGLGDGAVRRHANDDTVDSEIARAST